MYGVVKNFGTNGTNPYKPFIYAPLWDVVPSPPRHRFFTDSILAPLTLNTR